MRRRRGVIESWKTWLFCMWVLSSCLESFKVVKFLGEAGIGEAGRPRCFVKGVQVIKSVARRCGGRLLVSVRWVFWMFLSCILVDGGDE